MTMAVLAMWSVAAVWSIIVDRLAPGVLAKGVLFIGGIYSSASASCADLPEKE